MPANRAAGGGHIDWLLFGAAASVLLSLLPQIGEQVDYLRFLPVRRAGNRASWWAAVIGTGPGWVVLGGLKLLAGSFLAWLLLRRRSGQPPICDDPTAMYHFVFGQMFSSPTLALVVTGVFVIVCQVKINVTNAYAGSIAWSNFFSRVTHTHPGRVVWLVFNVLLALLLMEVGIFEAIESVLGIYANFAAGWIGAITADLVINKPLGLSPRGHRVQACTSVRHQSGGRGRTRRFGAGVERRASRCCSAKLARVLSPFMALFVAFVAAPAIAWWTKGRYYLARKPDALPADAPRGICVDLREHASSTEDMALCPAYGGAICSLCCSLDARCRDQCKTEARVARSSSPGWCAVCCRRASRRSRARAPGTSWRLLLVIEHGDRPAARVHLHAQAATEAAAVQGATAATLWLVFFCFLDSVVRCHLGDRAGAGEPSRRGAANRRDRPTMLMDEIEAHNRTDAALQRAKEVRGIRQPRQVALHHRPQPRDPHAAEFHLWLCAADGAHRASRRLTMPCA